MSLEEFGVTDDLRQGEHHLVHDLASLSGRPAIDEQLLAEGVCSYLSGAARCPGRVDGRTESGSGCPARVFA